MLTTVEVLFLTAVLIAIAGFTTLQLRRALLFRRGATVACAFRHHGRRSWKGGVARFDPDALRAYRIVGVGLRPYTELSRSGLAVGERRSPSTLERRSLMAVPVIVDLHLGSERVEMALGQETLPGLLAWIEGSPGRFGL